MKLEDYEYYRTDLGVLYCGDCLEVMPLLEAESVDLVVADPPFNIGFNYGTDFDDNKPLGKYLDWLEDCMSKVERVCKEGHLIFLWQSMKHCRQVWGKFPKARLMAGCKNFIQINKTDVQWAFDPILFWHKGDTKYLFAGRGQLGIRRDWHIGQTCRWILEGTEHPCPRPIDIVKYIIRQWADQGLVLDPFLGSGTTAVACEQLNRRWIGIEISEKYCEIAKRRIDAEARQLKMFR